MNKALRLKRMAIALGLITLTGPIFSVFALTDVYQQAEPDLSMEWAIVRFIFLFSLMFIAVSMIVMIKYVR